jgi:hypothetical protein
VLACPAAPALAREHRKAPGEGPEGLRGGQRPAACPPGHGKPEQAGIPPQGGRVVGRLRAGIRGGAARRPARALLLLGHPRRRRAGPSGAARPGRRGE